MSKEIKIGAMVIIIVAFSYWGYVFLKGKDIFQNSITVVTYYADVDQLAVSAPVLINGVKVGNVTDVILSPKNIEQVEVHFTIEGIRHVPEDAIATLKSTSIMGGKAIDILFDKPCLDENGCLEEGSVLESKNLSLINSMLGVDMDTYINDMENKISGITNDQGEQFNYAQILLNLQVTIANLKKVSAQASEIIDGSSQNIRNITYSLDQFAQTLKQNNEKVTQIMGNLADVTEKLNQVDINGTVESAKSAVDETKLAVSEIKGTLENAKSTFDRIDQVVTKIESGEGSLGLLINDKELYNELTTTSDQISLLLQDIRLNPKRYINVSVFGGKKSDEDYVYPKEDPANDE